MGGVTVKKDKKWPCYEVGHRRAGYWESIFLTEDELRKLSIELDKLAIW